MTKGIFCGKIRLTKMIEENSMAPFIPLILIAKKKASNTLSVEDNGTVSQESWLFKLSTPHEAVKARLDALGGITHKIDEDNGNLVWHYKGEKHAMNDGIKKNINIIVQNIILVMKEAEFSIKSARISGEFFLTEELRIALTCDDFQERRSAHIIPSKLVIKFEED